MSTQNSESFNESSTTDQAKEKAQQAAGQAKQKAGSQLRSQVDQRSTDAGELNETTTTDRAREVKRSAFPVVEELPSEYDTDDQYEPEWRSVHGSTKGSKVKRMPLGCDQAHPRRRA